MRVLVCGAGVAGLTTAWWLGRRGWDVLLIERDEHPRDAGHLLDVGGPGYDVLDRMGLLPTLNANRRHIPAIVYVDEDGGTLATVSYLATAALLKGRLLTVMRGDLEAALTAVLPPRVQLRRGVEITAVEDGDGPVRVTLSDGSVQEVDLLIGADGLHSTVRRLVFGPDRLYMRPLGQHCATFLFHDDELAACLGPDLKVLSLADRQAGFSRTTDGRVAAFLVHRGDRSPADPVAEVRSRCAGMGWIVDRALAQAPPSLHHAPVTQVELASWHVGRTVLVGDAGAGVSALAGHGASLAVFGAFRLADSLLRSMDPSSGMASYQQGLMPAVQQVQRAGRRAAGWVAPTTRWQIAIRDAVPALSGGG
ncbi:FAD-dependent oxidoreductase [Kutzneria kofuensis]|uniref:2-polyprenyl-6-methoxyphenol hydroxylase-like FAD-dependent oxidoreductase n=1 Tax=Kutzneria kofuensis TaxID=103725 RepID=A0A7W9KD04_9PSEU|nr:FAD-dependent oxidoreductase [Kutzneria kofuensis]MBB5890306.1 2-polyprenyl-6-methoxyphenol hydroxylase-like FAD-dependent oxidoreductase [Kutzneria kofuensis]